MKNNNVIPFPCVEKPTTLSLEEINDLREMFEEDEDGGVSLPSTREEYLLYLSEVVTKDDYITFLEALLLISAYKQADPDLQQMVDHYWNFAT